MASEHCELKIVQQPNQYSRVREETLVMKIQLVSEVDKLIFENVKFKVTQVDFDDQSYEIPTVKCLDGSFMDPWKILNELKLDKDGYGEIKFIIQTPSYHQKYPGEHVTLYLLSCPNFRYLLVYCIILQGHAVKIETTSLPKNVSCCSDGFIVALPVVSKRKKIEFDLSSYDL